MWLKSVMMEMGMIMIAVLYRLKIVVEFVKMQSVVTDIHLVHSLDEQRSVMGKFDVQAVHGMQ